MKLDFTPRLQYEGFGNVQYETAGTPSGTPTGARNGLSVDATVKAVLGQDVGAAGDPAGLLNDREIPDNGFTVWVGKALAASRIGLSATQGIDATNTGGRILQSQSFGVNFSLRTLSATVFRFAFGALQWTVDTVALRRTTFPTKKKFPH